MVASKCIEYEFKVSSFYSERSHTTIREYQNERIDGSFAFLRWSGATNPRQEGTRGP